MKIMMFGNTNNYPLRLAEALNDLGHDTSLIVNRKELLHRPESARDLYRPHYPAWMHDVSDISEDDFVAPSMKIARVLDLLAQADALILNDIGPSLLPLLPPRSVAKRILVFLTGSDLSYYADYKTIASRQADYCRDYTRGASARLERELWSNLVRRQRTGILQSDLVSYFPKGMVPSDDRLLKDIGVSNDRRFFIYMCADVPREEDTFPANEIPRIFCGMRLTWKKPVRRGGSALDYKGADIMVRGLGKYVANTNGKLDIRLVEKGLHVSETKRLIDDVGLSSHVTWLPEMTLDGFYEEAKMADICFDQLGKSCIGMAGLDMMAMGKPLIANARPRFWKSLGEPWPVCQASDVDEVCSQMNHLLSDETTRRNTGQQSRLFVKKYFSPEKNALMCIEKLLQD